MGAGEGVLNAVLAAASLGRALSAQVDLWPPLASRVASGVAHLISSVKWQDHITNTARGWHLTGTHHTKQGRGLHPQVAEVRPQ